jgi:hypothetical protein
MLAIQRPRMGSSQPAEGAGPFGCTYPRSPRPCSSLTVDRPADSFNGRGDDLLFFEPPQPAPGEPILSFEETNSLHNILEQLTSNNYSAVSFGEGLNFSDEWQQLPPQFMGTATSYGHQSAQPFTASMFDFTDIGFDAIQFPSNNMPPPHLMQPPRTQSRVPLRTPHNQNQHSQADAAAVLHALQTGQSARSSSINRPSVLQSQAMAPPSTHSMARPQGHFAPGRSSPIRPPPIPSPVIPMSEHRDEHLFADMTFGNPHGQNTHRIAQQVPEDVRWGSDRNFGLSSSFLPRNENETAEVLENERIKYLDCLQLNHSATNTRPPSPLGSGNNSPINGRNGKLNGHHTLPQEVDGPPRKWRKTPTKGEIDDDEDNSLLKSAARKRKSKDNLHESNEASSSSAAPGKRRRKSNVNGPKQPPTRENLSEEAKVSSDAPPIPICLLA